MRIDLVITELFVGGAERQLTDLAIGLAASGDRVRVFSIGSLPTGHQAQLVDRLKAENISVDTANSDRTAQALGALRKLQAWLAESPPDVCQTFLFHANVLGMRAASGSGIKTRLAGVRVAERKCKRNWLEKSALKKASSVVCVSNSVCDFVKQYLGCSDRQTLVIPNAVDVNRFATAQPAKWSELGWPDDACVSIFVGRLHPQKGIASLRNQIDSIATPGTNQRLLIVGDGPQRSELERWANQLGQGRVKLLGWQPNVAPLIRASRLLILPSLYEGMPNVVMEAMASAKPVVCSRVEGSDELLAHQYDCQTFDVGDELAMKKLVESFQSDELLCESVGLGNQERVRNDFSIPSMVAAYRSLYKRLHLQAT